MTTKARPRPKASRAKRRVPPSDPVTQYAIDVRDGAVVAGRAVRLAAERHLADLARQCHPDFPYRFEPPRVAAMCEFFEQFLTLDEVDPRTGEHLPFRLVRWLQFSFGSLVGWVHMQTGRLRFQEAYFETGKGSAKTPAAAGFGLYRLVGEDRTAVENYSLGVNGDQANYLYGFAKKMAERSDELSGLLDVGEYNTAWLDRNSFFRPLTSEGRSLDNKRVFTALIDELHEHPSPVIPEKMLLGIKSQVDALVIMLTNAGHDKTSVCWTKHEYGIKVLEGTVRDDQFFTYICQLDPCERCRSQGKTQPDDGCPDCDDWTDERVWPKANPALDELPAMRDYIRGVVRRALNQPTTLARVKRLNFCQWTQGHTIWIPSDQWQVCETREKPLEVVRGAPTAFAFDMSMKIDLCAGVGAQRIDDGAPTEQVEIQDNELGETVKRIWAVNYRIRLHSYAWIPRDTMLERVQNEHIPYDLWARDGWVRVTPGPVIDHHLIADEFLTEIGPRFKPQRIAYDPYNATEFAVGLRDRGKYETVEVGQGRKLSEFIKLFEALVRLRRIEHDGSPAFAWCVSNAEPRTDRYENVWLEKPTGGKRIDLAIAAVMAVSQVVVLPAPRQKMRGPRVWTPTGWIPSVAEVSDADAYRG